jgi:hypothetical protein
MDHPRTQQERAEEKSVTPSEVWEQLSPESQERITCLLGRMAYKYVLSSGQQLSKDEDCGNGDEK